MLEMGTIGERDGTGTLGKAAGSPENMPLRLTLVMSAHNTTLRMIRFSDENASFALLFLGILLSIFGIRGDRAQFIVLFLLFLATMVRSLFSGLKTIVACLDPLLKNPDRQRFDGNQEVLRFPVAEYVTRLRVFRGVAATQEMVHERYATIAIEPSRFDRINRYLRRADASFVAWVAIIVMTIAP
jgi:hypothetical protein